MSKIKSGGLDRYGADPSNSSSLEQLALKGFSAVYHSGDVSTIAIPKEYLSRVTIPAGEFIRLSRDECAAQPGSLYTTQPTVNKKHSSSLDVLMSFWDAYNASHVASLRRKISLH